MESSSSGGSSISSICVNFVNIFSCTFVCIVLSFFPKDVMFCMVFCTVDVDQSFRLHDIQIILPWPKVNVHLT